MMKQQPVITACAIAILFSTVAITAFSQSDVADALKQARSLAVKDNFIKAHETLDELLVANPNHDDVLLEKARFFSWQGDFKKSRQTLNKVTNTENPDVQVLKGYLDYYTHDFEEAEKTFEQVLKTAPEYEDARVGLDYVRQARESRELYRADHSLSFGLAMSSFSGRSQSAWRELYTQYSRVLNDGDTVVTGHVTRYDQFNSIDNAVGFRVYQKINDDLGVYGGLNFSPGASFRPRRQLVWGGRYRVYNQQDGLLPELWFTLDGRNSRYENSVEVTELNPGLRYEAGAGWSAAAKLITVNEEGRSRLYGNDFRFELPVYNKVRLMVGRADAPETVAGVTVDTESYYGGMTIELDPKTYLRLGYTHEDREDTYIRRVFNVGVTFKF